MSREHPMWLRDDEPAALRGRTIAVVGDGELFDTVRAEAARPAFRPDAEHPQIVITGAADSGRWLGPDGVTTGLIEELGDEAFLVVATADRVVLVCGGAPAALHAWFHLVREVAVHHALPGATGAAPTRHEPQYALRMLNHWDNVDVHPVMGQVERGYAGASIFFRDGSLREDLDRVSRYARLLASIGINRVTFNNVNVHRREARLLTDDLGYLVRLAGLFRPWGIRVHLSVSFAAPILVGGLASADPLDPAVQTWWRQAVSRVYDAIPDFGGFVVKADSEGQPGPFAYGRDHADGANLLARALAPHGGIVHWRAFVYNHRQDWRDRRTDRARAAYDTFAPLDGRFDDNVILQVKYGPTDFQVREPVSPVIPAMHKTAVALELQLTQEYTGQQLHAVYLAPQWREILDFAPFGGDGPPLADLARGGIVAVANVGDDAFWTGHPLAQANLYAYGRLAWDARMDPRAILDEWIALTFGDDDSVRRGVHAILDDSWLTFESYTAPLGVGFMVTPGTHYGPAVDGYEYSPWGTYHFADHAGIGVDRTVATGTGFAGQFPEPWASAYESLDTVPDELLLFLHHVPYTHRLHSGTTVIQHIYDTHVDGADAVARMVAEWDALEGRVPADVFERVRERLAEQQRSAEEWRDQICTYFWRKSGIPDDLGRLIP